QIQCGAHAAGAGAKGATIGDVWHADPRATLDAYPRHDPDAAPPDTNYDRNLPHSVALMISCVGLVSRHCGKYSTRHQTKRGQAAAFFVSKSRNSFDGTNYLAGWLAAPV